MASLSFQSTWSLTLDTNQLRLVLKALGGRLKPEDIEPAKQLGDIISQRRALATRQAAQHAEHLLSRLDQSAAGSGLATGSGSGPSGA